ncbi:hypothetical protein [Undibacterium danionis]|uniref:Uncharacterized protein n=1 Tax=Undibacterium danionis TaxID=1812100 RepID=A0ABV6IJ43_9BURK
MSHNKKVSIDPRLYWSLPGPTNFISQIRQSVASSSLLWINMPNDVIQGVWNGIEEGLSHTQIERVKLYIRAGTDIATDLAPRLLQTNEIELTSSRMTAQELAHFNLKEIVVLLIPEDDHGLLKCRQFASDFYESLQANTSTCTAHVIFCDRDEKITDNRQDKGISIIVFDGGLTPDEMDAYVALRMLERPGPGSTKLVRGIVSEFAGFDVEFAEQIMSLDESQIMNICNNLSLLQSDSHSRWRQPSWISRSQSLVSPGVYHVLHDCYLTNHGTPHEKEQSAKRIKSRYWRACIKVITPWLEERRSPVLACFKQQIQAIADRNCGTIPTGRDGFFLDPEQIEYNNVVGMARKELKMQTQKQLDALSICKKVKAVRDEIAHLRMPDVNNVFDLIFAMDRYLQ